MKRLNKLVVGAALLLLGSLSVNAQQTVEMADGMRAEGKIYVVVAIILTVLFGLIGYLFLLDRKIGKLEKQVGLDPNKTT